MSDEQKGSGWSLKAMDQQKWYEGDSILFSAWILGKLASMRESELAGMAKTPRDRSEHIDKATTLGLASNVAAGVLGYKMFKKSPKLVTVVAVSYFGLSAYIASTSLS